MLTDWNSKSTKFMLPLVWKTILEWRSNITWLESKTAVAYTNFTRDTKKLLGNKTRRSILAQKYK